MGMTMMRWSAAVIAGCAVVALVLLPFPPNAAPWWGGRRAGSARGRVGEVQGRRASDRAGRANVPGSTGPREVESRAR